MRNIAEYLKRNLTEKEVVAIFLACNIFINRKFESPYMHNAQTIVKQLLEAIESKD